LWQIGLRRARNSSNKQSHHRLIKPIFLHIPRIPTLSLLSGYCLGMRTTEDCSDGGIYKDSTLAPSPSLLQTTQQPHRSFVHSLLFEGSFLQPFLFFRTFVPVIRSICVFRFLRLRPPLHLRVSPLLTLSRSLTPAQRQPAARCILSL